jgi:ketosteroid isomerase-like protein
METSDDSYVVTASRMLAKSKDWSNANEERGVKEQGFQPDRAWWERIFAVVDGGDSAGFVELLTADARFRFGSAAPMVGSDAIRAAVAGFFSAIRSSCHRLQGTWAGDATAVCEGEVTYTRHDGSMVSFPFVNVFELRGELIAAYRIYIDLSSLFSGPP